MNEMNSKGHLRQTKGSNAKGDVPAEIAAEYKKYFPRQHMRKLRKCTEKIVIVAKSTLDYDERTSDR